MHIQKGVETAFPGIGVVEGTIKPLAIQRDAPLLESLKEEIITEIQARYTLESVKDEPLFRAYRDFFWTVGVDPTKTRPASEALVRRILAGKTLPTINTAVDAYNLASARSGIPLAAFDAETLTGNLTMRFAEDGEEFLGIGMTKPVILSENQVILTDAEAIIAIYPYRDSDATKITVATEAIHLVACGVPKVESVKVARAYELGYRYLKKYVSGTRR